MTFEKGTRLNQVCLKFKQQVKVSELGGSASSATTQHLESQVSFFFKKINQKHYSLFFIFFEKKTNQYLGFSSIYCDDTWKSMGCCRRRSFWKLSFRRKHFSHMAFACQRIPIALFASDTSTNQQTNSTIRYDSIFGLIFNLKISSLFIVSTYLHK